MTNSARFQPIKDPFERTYQRYHGAGVVAFVLSCADCWTAWRKSQALADGNTQAAQIPHRRDAEASIPIDGVAVQSDGQAAAYSTQANAPSNGWKLSHLPWSYPSEQRSTSSTQARR